MKAFKLMHIRKDGTIGSLFINRKAVLPMNKWLKAESYPTIGFKYRPLWHATAVPIAPHLSIKNREWFEVEIKNTIKLIRPSNQGGKWYLAKFLKIIKKVSQNQANYY